MVFAILRRAISKLRPAATDGPRIVGVAIERWIVVWACMQMVGTGIGSLAAAEDGAASDAEPIASRPNVVWIMAEDSSKHYYQHFDPSGAATPNIESMAQSGVTFERAFSNAPVCSVARTTLITGCYAPRVGTQFHRRLQLASLPPEIRMFPQYLREAGYHTSNRSKEDYNAAKTPDVWDASGRKAHWRDRSEPAQPFFHVRTITTSHESSLHFDEEDRQNPTRIDPSDVSVPPYLPDTELTRYTVARYHDRIGDVDQSVGNILEELTSDGLLEDTFVFFFGDHGGVLPRSKGHLYEAGLHVPLVVRIPENFAGRVDRSRGDRSGGFVEFVDFAPTVLAIAEVDIPESMDGQAFLGNAVVAEQVDSRDRTYGYADRMDEKYDFVRSMRIGDLKYIRRFDPIYPESLVNLYRERMLAYQQWRNMHNADELLPAEDQFFQPRRCESLFDLSEDPHEIHDLIDDPSRRGDLLRMRNEMTTWMKSLPDLSFMTEVYLIEGGLNDPIAFGQENRAAIERYIDIANYAVQPFDSVKPMLMSALSDDDPLVRYWAIVAALGIGEDAASLVGDIERRLVDLEPFVVARAIEFVAMHDPGGKDPRPFLYRSLNRTANEAEALLILRAARFLQDHAPEPMDLDMKLATMHLLPRPSGKGKLPEAHQLFDAIEDRQRTKDGGR